MAELVRSLHFPNDQLSYESWGYCDESRRLNKSIPVSVLTERSIPRTVALELVDIPQFVTLSRSFNPVCEYHFVAVGAHVYSTKSRYRPFDFL